MRSYMRTIGAFEPFIDVAKLKRPAEELLNERPALLTERRRLALEVFAPRGT